jgi:hypothetical protein
MTAWAWVIEIVVLTKFRGRFYEHFGVIPSPTDALHLYVLLKDIKRLAGD